jgi:hypothetical protein
MIMADWTAYCAPGHRAHAAIVLALKGKDLTAIEETAALQGSDIILVNNTAIEEAFKPDRLFEMSPPTGILARSPFDPLRMLCEDLAREPGRRLFLPVTGV